jgi:hypothetical protein
MGLSFPSGSCVDRKERWNESRAINSSEKPAGPNRRPRARWRNALAAPGEPRICTLEQFCQIHKAVYRQLLVTALAGRREVFNISANALPRNCSSGSIKGALRLVGVQNTFNHVIITQTPKLTYCNSRTATFRIFASTHRNTEGSRPAPSIAPPRLWEGRW